jgi:small-conductance mechanosensitive channel
MKLGQKNNVHYGIENIAKLVVAIGFITTALSSFGIQLWEVITSITIVATAIAILTKEYIADFLVGIHLSFSNMFEVGDFVKVGDKKGEVLGINMLKTMIKNENDDIVMLPNTTVHYNEIVNYTQRDIREMSVEFQLEKTYIQGADELRRKIISALSHLDKYFETDSYEIEVLNVKNGYFDLKFKYTLQKVSMDIHRKARKIIIQQVYQFILDEDKANMGV